MDILRIRNEKGEWVGIPAIKGENAYELAVAHGYEGTQEEWLASLKGDKGNKGDKGDKGDNGESTKIIAYALGLGKDVAVGYNAVMPDELYGRIKHLDLVVDTLGGCMFQYKEYEGDDEGSMPSESFKCVSNPNGKDGKDGKDAVVDTVLNAESENAIANKEVWAWFDIFAKTSEDTARQTARTDLSNVSDEDFRAKAEAAGVGGDAGLAEEKCIMDIKGEVENYTYLPSDAPEGAVYFTEKECSIPNNDYIKVSSGSTSDIDAAVNVSAADIQIISGQDPLLYHAITNLIDNGGTEGVKVRVQFYHPAYGTSVEIYFTATGYDGGLNPGPNMYYYYINGTLDEGKSYGYEYGIDSYNYPEWNLYVLDESNETYPAGGYARYNGKWIKL